MLEKLDVKEWLQLNAQLQKKKSALRSDLKARGVLKKGAENKFDKYTYFSEAQYKSLFTDLFSAHGLELKFDEIEYATYTGTEKQAIGRMPKLTFTLFDTDTGFYENTTITGEGMDKGDKAGYKAYTGALKYYLANTFMVATGDDPEKDSPDEKIAGERKATPAQLDILTRTYTGENMEKLLAANRIEKIEDLPMATASRIIAKLKGAR